MELADEGTSFRVSAGQGGPTLKEELAVDSRDIANCFNVFLGRMPANGPAAQFANSDVSKLLQHILETEEFKTNTLRSLLLREALPHTNIEATPSLRLVDWAQLRLPIGASTRRTLGGARTWAQLLEVLLSDSNVAALCPDLVAAEVDQLLRARLEKENIFQIKRSVIGAIDAASAFEIRGWAVDLCDKSVPVILEFYADSTFIGAAACVEPRPDVQDVVGGDGKVGFTFKISAAHRPNFARGRSLFAIDSVSRQKVGPSTMVYADPAQNWDVIRATRSELAAVREILERIEARLPEISRMASTPIEAYNEYWHRFYRPSRETRDEQRDRSEGFTYRPLISVIIPTWNSNTRLLDKAMQSVLAQSYDRWELVITDDASDRSELALLQHRYADDPRIRWVKANFRTGISQNTNQGIAASGGEYIAFLDHDDELAPDALYSIAEALQEHHYCLLYTDEDRIEEDEFGRCLHHTPFFKPSFDPDLLLSINYFCHLVVLRRDIVDAAGGLRTGFEGAQDHDLLLRVVAIVSARDTLHVPRVLYHWRVTPGSVSGAPALTEEIQRNIVAAVDDHIRRLNLHAKAEPHNDPVGTPRQFATRVRWHLPSIAPSISIIVATRDRLDLLQPCLTSVLDSISLYPGQCEILVVDNDSTEPGTLRYLADLSGNLQARVLRFQGPFNWSAINNAAAREAQGEVLLFLNNDTIVITKDWCTELAAHAVRADVGAVGARLLYADGTIQHAGVLLGIDGVAGHESIGESTDAGGYFGRGHLLRSAAAVTGACLATRREVFRGVEGGFDELNLTVAFNDVDYCLKVLKAGYRVVYNPFAVLYHFESKSRGRDVSATQQTRHRAEVAAFRQRWTDDEIVDPYYNPHFDRFGRPFERLLPPPVERRRAIGVWAKATSLPANGST